MIPILDNPLFGRDPKDYFFFLLVLGLMFFLAWLKWWLVPISFGLILLSPYLIGPLRALWRGARVGARATGLNRRPGALYCAECGALLAPAGGDFSPHACPECSGKWCLSADLTRGAAATRKTLADWKAHDEKLELPCPKCFQPMRGGSFLGATYTAFHCRPCGGFWFNRVDWVSLELS